MAGLVPLDNFGTVVGENPDCLLLFGTVVGENPDHVCWGIFARWVYMHHFLCVLT